MILESRYEEAVEELYKSFINGWNARNAGAMAATFCDDGEMIGFDGSIVCGASEIQSHLSAIFSHHKTAPFVYKVKSVRCLSPNVAVLRAIVGMIPEGQTEINPAVNAHQTVIALHSDVSWQIHLLQNTPAQFHGRPELVAQMTAELREVLK